jgi:hypothetical protein
MTAKGLIIDFLNLIFLLLVVGLTIIYFIAGDNFDNFKRIMESLAPFGGLGILFLVNLKFWRQKAKKKERDGDFDVNLHLTVVDKLRSDFFLFLLPICVLLIAFAANGKVGVLDVIEAGTVFIVAYLWQKWLFSKERM